MAWSAILLKNSNVKLNYDVLASFKKLTPRVSKEMKYFATAFDGSASIPEGMSNSTLLLGAK